MPKGKSKKFIDKKNSVTFQLVHRSQRDPLIADDDAPLRILRPLIDPQAGKHLKKDADKRKEELEKYGIHFDDDYDYMQHLRSSEKQSTEWERIENSNCSQKKEIDKTKFNLPAKIFESAEEEKIGLLNRAIPKGLQLDLDPDIVATFEDDYNHDNPEDSDCDFEEDFIALAGGVLKEGEIPEEDDEYDEDEDEDDDDDDDDDSCGHMEISDEEGDELGSLHGGQFTFRDEETRSRFTEYSMSSSVMRRNNQLTLLDDRFEKMYAEYDDSEIGALEGEEIDGNCDPDMDLLLRHVEKFKNEQKQQETESKDIAKLIKERMKLDDNSNSEDDEATNNVKLVVNNSENEKWDCESVLTTYSNIYNHPKIIVEPRGEKLGKIKINSKTGIPKDVLDGPGGKLTAKNLAQFDRINNDRDERNGAQSIAETMRSVVSELSVRPKDETPEERKERKKALKDYRRERRIERKANSEAFKEEKKRQEKIMLNNRINIQGNRLV